MGNKITIRQLKNKYDFRFSKSLGQNFLTDGNIIDNIIEGSNIGENDLVIEIGPGMGAITNDLCQIAKKVIAIEIDSKLIPVLDDIFKDDSNIEVINQDILKMDLLGLIEGELESFSYENVKVIGNLPYYITTPIIMKLLEDNLPVSSITVMMQKEVADRIMASAGDKNRGAISAAVEYYATVEKICKVPNTVFFPPPKVDSAVIRIDIRKEKCIDVDTKILFRIIKAGFGQRRKTLLNSLSSGLSMEKSVVKEILKEAGIDEKRRAETLTMEEFGAIVDNLGKH